jgi:hypothetical protein
MPGGLARPLRLVNGMLLTPHTQVENLANLLAVRRRQAQARRQRGRGCRGLVATVLEVPIDAVGASPPARRPVLLSRHAGSLETGHQYQAA